MSFKIKKNIVCFVIAIIGCFLIADAMTTFGVLALIWASNVEKIQESDCK